MYVEEKKPGEDNIDEVGKILLEAANYIERHGWCQFRLATKQGEVCARGAIRRVLDISTDEVHVLTCEEAKALGRLLEYLGQRGLSDWNDYPGRTKAEVSFWNDYPGRTKEQVVAALRRAARA